jgi:hypothetical protein
LTGLISATAANFVCTAWLARLVCPCTTDAARLLMMHCMHDLLQPDSTDWLHPNKECSADALYMSVTDDVYVLRQWSSEGSQYHCDCSHPRLRAALALLLLWMRHNCKAGRQTLTPLFLPFHCTETRGSQSALQPSSKQTSYICRFERGDLCSENAVNALKPQSGVT